MLMWPMSRTKIWQSLARVARFLTNQMIEMIEMMPWITMIRGKSVAAIVGARYRRGWFGSSSWK